MIGGTEREGGKTRICENCRRHPFGANGRRALFLLAGAHEPQSPQSVFEASEKPDNISEHLAAGRLAALVSVDAPYPADLVICPRPRCLGGLCYLSPARSASRAALKNAIRER